MFNLEKAIQEWKRSLRKNPGYEDGDIEELESHLRDRVEELVDSGREMKTSFEMARTEIGNVEEIGQEFHKTSVRSATYLPANSVDLNWGILGNFIKISRRNLIRNKLYSTLNIVGLVIGITAALFIYLFIQNELSYDSFHANSDRIYKVNRVMERPTRFDITGITSAPFRSALELDFPDMIEKVTHIARSGGVVTIEDQNFMENQLYMADVNFFSVFSFPFEAGDPETALAEPNTIVLSQETAEKYFGDENPIGKNLLMDGEDYFEVTGVFQIPSNSKSHLNFDLVFSMATFSESSGIYDWWNNQFHTYALLSPEVNHEDLSTQLPGFMDKYFGENMIRHNRRVDLSLLPLKDVYFANYVSYDFGVEHGNETVVNIFGVVAILIIVVAGVNFINLATARSVNRAKEIGIKKTLGAKQFSLFIQFMGEALLLSFISGIISLILVYSMMPFFELLVGSPISLNLLSIELFLALVSILLVTGLLAGIYPAIFLSSFKPIKALKERISFGTSQLVLRRILIVFQFTISSLLIIGVFSINRQLEFMSNKSLGFQPDQLLDISLNNPETRGKASQIANQFNGVPGVENTSMMSGSPGGFFDNYSFQFETFDNPITMKTLFIDDQFSEIFDLNMVSGRDFNKSFTTDSSQAVIINETATEFLGWSAEEALGKEVQNMYLDESPRTIVGVVEDFHFRSLHNSIDPLVASMWPDNRQLVLKINPSNLSQTIAQVEEIWKLHSPLYPMEYRFLDEQFAQLYASDVQQRKVFFAFSIIAVLIACLGLFGMATFSAEKRSKEMGIRKILGASLRDLLVSFNKEVIAVVGIAFLMAVPITFILVEEWLQNYAFRIDNNLIYYCLIGLFILVLSLITVSFQTLRVVNLNPIDSLRDE